MNTESMPTEVAVISSPLFGVRCTKSAEGLATTPTKRETDRARLVLEQHQPGMAKEHAGMPRVSDNGMDATHTARDILCQDAERIEAGKESGK